MKRDFRYYGFSHIVFGDQALRSIFQLQRSRLQILSRTPLNTGRKIDYICK